jgi:Na+-transporting methylmalonyl-CoA/oxaloacetate decarboxylase gamma subunit
MTSGLILTLVGMSVVFFALALLAATAWILERIFRIEDSRAKKTEVKASRDEMISADLEAVISLALAYHTRRSGFVRIDTADQSMWIQQTRVYQ